MALVVGGLRPRSNSASMYVSLNFRHSTRSPARTRTFQFCLFDVALSAQDFRLKAEATRLRIGYCESGYCESGGRLPSRESEQIRQREPNLSDEHHPVHVRPGDVILPDGEIF